MQQSKGLYLITLEVEPLKLAKKYNPLPSHLTLISRFLTYKNPEQINTLIRPIFNNSMQLSLNLVRSAVIGPKQTDVFIVEDTEALRKLHNDLLSKLESIDVEFRYPEYNGTQWTPHISNREKSRLSEGMALNCTKAYLIEVIRTTTGDERLIHESFSLRS